MAWDVGWVRAKIEERRARVRSKERKPIRCSFCSDEHGDSVQLFTSLDGAHICHKCVDVLTAQLHKQRAAGDL